MGLWAKKRDCILFTLVSSGHSCMISVGLNEWMNKCVCLCARAHARVSLHCAKRSRPQPFSLPLPEFTKGRKTLKGEREQEKCFWWMGPHIKEPQACAWTVVASGSLLLSGLCPAPQPHWDQMFSKWHWGLAAPPENLEMSEMPRLKFIRECAKRKESLLQGHFHQLVGKWEKMDT